MKHKTNNFIWIFIVLIVIAAQWTFHKYEVWDSVFSSTNEVSTERKVAYWVAPMDPNYVSDRPGKSPMGMDLVPVYEDEINPPAASTVSRGGNPAQVTIDPVTVQNIGVRSVPAELRKLSRKVRAVGKIDFDETRIASINTKISGWAEKLYIDFTGQKVNKGDPLIDIYSPELLTTQEEYLQALKFHDYFQGAAYSEAVQHSKDLLTSTRRRLELWDISNEQIAELEHTQQAKKIMTIFSPISGIVIQKSINEGYRIMPNMQLYEIADISNVWVQAEIYEFEYPWVEVGHPVTMTLSYYPGKEFSGKISFIYPYLDSKTRTIRVRFEFDNTDLLLKPDMYANVFIESTAKKTDIVIPVSAVILSGERSIVILDQGEGKFEPRNVTIGMESDGEYTILDGLQEGEKVVISAQFLIDSESRLREAQMKMLAPPAPNTGQAAEEETDPVQTVITLIGDGEMNYTCPMLDDMVFSAQPGRCPACNMNFIEMTENDYDRLEELQKKYPVKKIKG